MSKNERFLAKIKVSLKPTVNDPEGNTIAGALSSLSFDGVQGVRAGKYFEVTIEASGKKKASKLVDEMCSRLLANPVIETYQFEIEGLGR
jgi:phosphoribosylformylglycinamidine synthase subunit PurS